MSEQDFGNDSSSVDHHQEPTILGKKIKREDFDHLMDFYEADHRLSTAERQVMSKDLTNSGLSTMLWALLDSSIVVTMPLVYRRYQEKKLGGSLPAPARLPAFFKLIFFLVAGLGVYFWSSKYHAKTDQQYRIASLETDCTSGKFSEQEVETKQKLLDVWKSLDSSKLSLFTVYYFKTAADPSLAMKSPKDMVSFDPHAVMYVPPSGEQLEHSSRVFGAVKEHERQAPHWDKIREVNGFIPTKSKDANAAASTDDIRLSEEPRLVDGTAIELDNGPDRKSSAWDRLRKSN